MAIRWVGALVFMYFIFAVATWVITAEPTLSANATGNSTAHVNALLSFSIGQGHYDWGNFFGVGAHESFLTELWQIMTLNFPIWKEGIWATMRWIVAPITATVVFGLIVVFLGIFQRTV